MVGLYFYLTADILTKVFQKCSLSSPLPNIWICPNCWIWLVAMATKRIISRKDIKIISSEAIRGMKLKLCRSVHNISLYKLFSFCFVFLLPLLVCFLCYGSLKFPLTYNKKSESRSLLLSHCRYFDRISFMNVCWVVLHQALRSCTNFSFDLLPWQLKV